MRLLSSLLLACSLTAASGAERINHEGRILGDLVMVPGGPTDVPILFNTPEADAIVSSMQIMPRTSAWNEDVSGLPVHPNSLNIITRIRADLVAINTNRNALKVFSEMNYVLVPDTQPRVDVRIRLPGQMPEEGYPDDSDERKAGTADLATVPYPSNLPVETWPSASPVSDLHDWQVHTALGDRHTIAVMPGAGTIWESWIGRLTAGTPPWVVSVVARFDLNSNVLRTAGWTSADAAGLPMFPALIRYDECERGTIEHALRIVVNKSRREYIYPATHYASQIGPSDANFVNYPAMGQRVRLPSGFTIPTTWTKQSKAVAKALKKYGALVADNGGFFSVSACPDQRFPANCFNEVQTIDINQFEVVDTTPESGGPRVGTVPTCSAGPDQNKLLTEDVTLAGNASGSGVTTLWEIYASTPPAPGTMSYVNGNANSLAPIVHFSVAGDYTLRLKASDTTHAPAFDAVIIHVATSTYPLPTMGTINPTTRERNGALFTLIVNGTGFSAATRVTWTTPTQANLVPATINGGGTQLTVTVPASYLAIGTATAAPTIKVVNPGPGGGISAASQILNITADVTAPVISAVAASSLTTSGANIGWTTNEGSTSQVDYGLTAAYGSSTTVSGTLVTSHSRVLSGLTAGTLYHFRVISRDGASNLATSGDLTFTTAVVPPAGGGGAAGGGGNGGGCGLGGALAALLTLSALWLRR